MTPDGSVIVGWCSNSEKSVAFVFENGVMKQLPTPAPYTDTLANSISADGRVAIGSAWAWDGSIQANSNPQWSAGLVSELALPADTRATRVGADGSTVLANGSNGPFFWRNGTITPLEGLPQSQNCQAQDMSMDGTIVLGRCTVDDLYRAVRWTNLVPEELAEPPEKLIDGAGFSITATSWEATAAVGEAYNSAGGLSFIWDEDRGMRWVTLAMKDLGVDADSLTNLAPQDISDDGRTVVGVVPFGDYGRAFIARLP